MMAFGHLQRDSWSKAHAAVGIRIYTMTVQAADGRAKGDKQP